MLGTYFFDVIKNLLCRFNAAQYKMGNAIDLDEGAVRHFRVPVFDPEPLR